MPLEPRKPHKVRPRPAKPVMMADRYQAFINGELTVHDLDDEEVMRGQIRAKDGSFRGRPPTVVPREFATAIQERQRAIVMEELGAMVLPAMRTLMEIMNKQHPQPGDAARVKAAQLVLERNLGRVPETINLKAEVETWERHMGEVVVEVAYDESEPQKEIEQ